MWFGVLGTLVVRHDGLTLPVTSSRQRVVLAALTVRARHVVSFDDLALSLWDGAAPDGGRATVRTYVMRLRHLLGSQGERIVTRPPGYLLEADDDEVDLLAFTRLCGDGSAALRSGAWERASQTLREALALWRGSPLADVPSRALRDEHVPVLESLRLQATEWRIDADLRLGRHEALVPELQALTWEHPLREGLRAELMLALYRSGRQAEALAVFQSVRRALVGELGVEPGRGLQELQQRILDADPGLSLGGEPADHATVLPVREPQPVVPRQLPAAVAYFAGRDRELKALSQLLDEGSGGGSVVISAIGGTAGVGKTALAVHWAHSVAERFTGGQLHVNLRGFGPSGPPMTAAEAVRGFLDALGIAPERIPAGADAQAALYRSLLAGRRLLILLDNASGSDQVRPLLPGSPGCLVLVTSRAELTGLAAAEGASLLTVDVLSEDDAAELLARRVGHDRTAAEPAALGELVALCARLPLALAIVAARAAARPGFPLAALAADLRDESGRLDALDAGDAASSVRAVFSWSYRHLTEPAARMFRLLGVHPGPDISLAAAASLAGSQPADAREALAELTRLHLVAEHADGRYGFHDLLRAYAAEQARTRDGETGRSAAVHRLLDHYLHTACEAAQLLDPARDRISLDTPACGTAPELLAGYDQSLAWFDAEHPVLLASVRLAAEAGFDAWAWRLPSALTDFLYLRGHWPDMAATQQTALAAAQRLGDAPGQALACRHLARAHSLLGSRQDAEVFYRRALSLYQQLGDHIGQGRCHYGLAWSAQREGRHEVALDHGRQALAEFRAAGHRDGQATALNAIGWFHAHLGDYQQALACCERALALCRELGDRHSEAATWDSLGYARHHLGQHAEAIGCYQRALALFRELRDSYNEAATLINLGDTHQALGDALAARGAWQQALAILDDLRHPDAEMVRDKLGPAIADPSLPT